MGKRTNAQRQKYIHNFARTQMGALGIKADDYLDRASSREEVRYELDKQDFPSKFYLMIKRQSDEVLGRLVASGRGSWERSEGTPWNPRMDNLVACMNGHDLLVSVATDCVKAAIVDNLFDDAQKMIQS